MDNPRDTPSSSAPAGVTNKGGYGFIRNTNTWGVNSIPWDEMIAAGMTPLLAANDPNLDKAMAAAREHGIQPGIWVPAGDEGLPESYARRIVDLNKKYGPSTIVPNIEATGKGYSGSAGWNWNQRMMNELVRLGMPQSMAVAVLPNQDDFNYKAYTDQGVRVLPEAFGANTATDLFDPAQIRQTLIRNGVPSDMIDVLLAPSQGGSGSRFTIDDLSPAQLDQLASTYGTDPRAATPPTPEGGPMTDAAPSSGGGYQRIRDDAHNPAAISYAKTRLAALRAKGITAESYGLESLDPAAQWRALSTIVGAQQAIQGGHAADYHVGANVPTSVADYVNKLLTGATDTRPDEPGSAGLITPGGASAPIPERPSAATPAMLRALAQGRTPPGELVDAMRRVGPMQQAIHAAAGVRHLRGLASV